MNLEVRKAMFACVLPRNFSEIVLIILKLNSSSLYYVFKQLLNPGQQHVSRKFYSYTKASKTKFSLGSISEKSAKTFDALKL